MLIIDLSLTKTKIVNSIFSIRSSLALGIPVSTAKIRHGLFAHRPVRRRQWIPCLFALADLRHGFWISVKTKNIIINLYVAHQWKWNVCFAIGWQLLLLLLTDNLSMSFLSTRSKYSCLISRSKRLGRPGYMVEPPDSTMCLYNSGLISISAVWIVLNTSSAMPWPSTLIKCGWNRASGASKRSPPTLMTRPSGSCNAISHYKLHYITNTNQCLKQLQLKAQLTVYGSTRTVVSNASLCSISMS